ncbi:kinesin-like protein KIN-6 isoform X2 [Salvia splendens]|uniref:kinesin-like protein KIN-6 isoform X2 n=1 Tax=Salvia splendens TaxID=180675 RepID=UPI001C27A804|nr:kinesin-like protein KIN-6 isoform X2 [Salvia splendens]
MKSPLLSPCPATVTVRRNPPRRARPTPSSAIPFREPLSSPSLLRDIFATDAANHNPNNAQHIKPDDSSTPTIPENLKVFLRIRPPVIQKTSRTIAESKNAWPKNPKINSRPKTKKVTEICLQPNDDLRTVTVSTPQPLQEMKRIKSEVYEGFSRVFPAESSQNDVYEEMVKPLVDDFSKGKSGMLAALGPSGSGKTHTVFGSAREPGMVPLALRRIFSQDESSAAQSSRVVYLSMFEISSERGKGEKMIDLLHDGGDVSLQHSVLKGLREAVVNDAQQAESLIAHGMLKRATATTNSNSQSSRSQCIINIRWGSKQGGEEVDGNANNTTLTIVDLAGAEREKKTGNQGARLLESNFINNTSMVFGQCLRSLLEHQKNRNKTLQKHYKNSLLTRYLRDYLEGKKRMTLILTVKPGVEDYLDTSFLLRQASPFSKIKFKTVEETVNLTNKRLNQALPQAGQLKKMKFGSNENSLITEGKTDRCFPENLLKEIPVKAIEGSVDQGIQDNDENINVLALSNGISGLGIHENMLKGNVNNLKVKKDREYRIMQGFSKALWNVLKQYKEKLEAVEIENGHLRDSLANEKARSLDLKNELTNEKTRILDLENEVKELKTRCICRKPSTNVLQVSTHGSDFDLSNYQMAKTPEVKSDILSPSMRGLEKTENENTTNPSARDLVGSFASCSDESNEQHPQQLEDLKECSVDTENKKGSRDTTTPDTCFTNKALLLLPSTNSSPELVCCEDMGTMDIPCTAIQSTFGSVCINQKFEQDALNIVADVKNLESESDRALDGSCLVNVFEYESNGNSYDLGDLKDAKAKQEPTQLQNCMEAATQSTSGSSYTSHKSEQDALNIVGGVKSLELESESALNGSCLVDYLENESNRNSHDHEDMKDAKTEEELTQLQNDNGTSLVVQQNLPMAAHSHADLKSSESCQIGDTDNHANFADNDTSLVEEQNVSTSENLHSENLHADLKSSRSPQNGGKCYHVKEKEDTPKLLDSILPKEGMDAQNKPKSHKVASCNNQLTKKPRRRLQPASSLLLKDLSMLDINDENDKPKGAKAGKKVTTDEKSRTQGSLSLLNLLTKT